MSIYFVTGNSGKFAEVKSLLPMVEQIDLELDEIQEIDPAKVIAHKLNQAITSAGMVNADMAGAQPTVSNQTASQSIGPTQTAPQPSSWLVEDTSLYFEGLHGLPGPLIKWFLKSLKPAGLAELATKLPTTVATAKTIIGLAHSPTDIHFFEGAVLGQIVSPRGDNGFGWDCIFQPQGSSKTFAEMPMAEKHLYSMRQRAVKKLSVYLKTGTD